VREKLLTGNGKEKLWKVGSFFGKFSCILKGTNSYWTFVYKRNII